MAYFLLKLVPPRPTFPADATEAEGAAMNDHFGYWQSHMHDGPGIAVGPVFDPAGAWGMAVVEAADEAAATRLGTEDPVIKANLGFRYEVFSIPSLLLRQ